jgi:acetyl esterase/lipase
MWKAKMLTLRITPKKLSIPFCCCLFILNFMYYVENSFAQTEKFICESDIIYGQGGDEKLVLDLCQPAGGNGPFPGLVWIHGGGWGYWSTPRAQCPIDTAASKGFVAISIDYRSTSTKDSSGKVKYPFPAQIEDVKCAIRWLRANAPKYRVDPQRIGIVGFSSGGHLALLAGFTEPADGFEGTGGNAGISSRVQAVVCSAGMVEAVSFYENQISYAQRVELLLGGKPGESPALYKAASPLTHVRRNNPPTLFFQGDIDTLCPPAQAQLLKNKMSDVGASCTVIIKQGKGHVTFFSEPSLWSFLDDHLKIH